MRLAVFDFDGTLFRSPEAPAWHDKGWYVSQGSLGPPCVPQKPGPEWWIPNTVSAAREAISDRNTYAIMMTGRVDSIFRWRVPELLKQAGLSFDEVHLNKGGETSRFKLGVMAKVLRRYSFKKVEIWDDNSLYLKTYEKVLSKFFQVETHLIKARFMEPLCGPGELDPEKHPKKFVYEALVLPKREGLLSWWSRHTGKALLPNLHANHVTLRLTETMGPKVGALGYAQITGWFDNGDVQGVTVNLAGVKSDNLHPHITIATAPWAAPKDSNRHLENGLVNKVRGPVLKGIVGVSDGNRWFFKPA